MRPALDCVQHVPEAVVEQHGERRSERLQPQGLIVSGREMMQIEHGGFDNALCHVCGPRGVDHSKGGIDLVDKHMKDS